MKDYYTVTEVAAEFDVSKETVRSWIEKRMLLAIQPAGEGGAYRIPDGALRVFRERSGENVAARSRSRAQRIRDLSPDEFYQEHIAPVVHETAASAEELVRRMAHDQALVMRYPSFASDYSTYIRALAQTAGRVRAVGA